MLRLRLIFIQELTSAENESRFTIFPYQRIIARIQVANLCTICSMCTESCIIRTVMLWLNPITIFLFITLYPEVGGYDWLQLISRVGKTVHSIENSRWFRLISKIDLTAGGIHLSTPIPQETKSESSERQGLALRYNSMTVSNSYEKISTSSLANLQSELSKFENITTTNLGLLRVHRLGATALKKVPDSFLIGLISLIAAELLQREILRQSLSFPPIVQAIANKTAVELDVKLQLLSALQWNVGPFLEYELDNLQTQPIEILDKYVIGEIVFRIDRDLAPFLSKIIRDPALVKKIVGQVKAIVEILAIAIAKNSAAASSINTTKGGSRIIENFELMIEGGKYLTLP